jgi:type IV secretion system protein VirB2
MLAGVVLVLSQTGLASTNTSLSMMETPLQVLQQSLSGPVALAIGIIAFCLAGAVLIFNGELSDFAKRGCYLVLVLAVLLTANTLVGVLFTSSTAIIF